MPSDPRVKPANKKQGHRYECNRPAQAFGMTGATNGHDVDFAHPQSQCKNSVLTTGMLSIIHQAQDTRSSNSQTISTTG